MVDRVELVQNDTGPQIMLTLADSITGAAINLSALGTEVVMHFSINGEVVPKAIIPLVIGPNAALGQCMLDWPVGVLDTAGSYVGEVQITSPEGRIQTTYTKIKFKVREQLA